MHRRFAAALLLGGAFWSASCARPADRTHVVANDNRARAGVLRHHVLSVRLDAVRAVWHPETDSGPGIRVEAFAEAGKAPQIPGPLLRVATGDTIDATIHNTLPDSSVTVFGFQAHPGDVVHDSLIIRPGDSAHVRFAAGEPGTYLYAAWAPRRSDLVERETLAGALVVDSAGPVPDDRVFVMNIWGDQLDSVNYTNALAINGRSYPHTEHISTTVGDTLRWRWVNATQRVHPMHLHGFYFTVSARGGPGADTLLAPAQRRAVVTEDMRPFGTMAIAWSPDRDGHWLFHCHIGFHVAPEAARLLPPPGTAPDTMASMSGDVMRHMTGLVLPIDVRAPPGWHAAARRHPRALRLFADEGRRRGRAPRAMSYVLQRGAEPARDSVRIADPIVLTRGEPTDITIVNRLPEATGLHWHGLELESRSDGVSGWSGTDDAVTASIAPGDSFVARLSLPRAGTFIYHTHLHDLVQLTSGLYGPLIVLEPGRQFDPSRDHVVLAGWDGAEDPPHLLVNGDSVPAALALAAGVPQRFRLVNIGVARRVRYRIERAGRPERWQAVAKDGADLPPAQRDTVEGALLDVGETADFAWTPAAGDYRLVVGTASAKTPAWVQRISVR